MLNKNLDEWLYLTGMENALDELEKAEKNHTLVHLFQTATDKNKQRCWIVFVQRKKMMSG